MNRLFRGLYLISLFFTLVTVTVTDYVMLAPAHLDAACIALMGMLLMHCAYQFSETLLRGMVSRRYFLIWLMASGFALSLYSVASLPLLVVATLLFTLQTGLGFVVLLFLTSVSVQTLRYWKQLYLRAAP